jgi:hypothetical protein
MSDVQITLNIPEELAKNAAQLGLLSPEHLLSLLESEVDQKSADSDEVLQAEKRERERDSAIQKAREMMAKLDALEPKLSEEEIEQEIRAARSST